MNARFEKSVLTPARAMTDHARPDGARVPE
jgi:hypothetical protein